MKEIQVNNMKVLDKTGKLYSWIKRGYDEAYRQNVEIREIRARVDGERRGEYVFKCDRPHYDNMEQDILILVLTETDHVYPPLYPPIPPAPEESKLWVTHQIQEKFCPEHFAEIESELACPVQ